MPSFVWGLIIGFVFALIGYVKNHFTKKLLDVDHSGAVDYSVVAVIAAKNEESVIENTVRNLLDNSPQTFRVIVVDDKSTDSTYEILSKLTKEYPNLTVVQNTSAPGKSEALNVALDLVEEDIVLFLDADARVDWDFVKEYSKLFRSPKINVVFTDFESYNQSRTLAVILQDLYFSFIKAFVYSGLFSPTIFMNSGLFIRRKIFDVVGKFDPQTLVDDFDLALRLWKRKLKVKFVRGKRCKIQYAFRLRDLFMQHCRWYVGGIKKIFEQFSEGYYLGIIALVAIGAFVLFPILMLILAYLLKTDYPLSTVMPLFWGILYSSCLFSYLFHDGHRPREILINTIIGVPVMYAFFQIAILVSFVSAFKRETKWHKVKREKI